MIGTLELTKTETQAIERGEKCPRCRDRYLITCPAHMATANEYGDCGICDEPAGTPGKVNCPCGELG